MEIIPARMATTETPTQVIDLKAAKRGQYRILELVARARFDRARSLPDVHYTPRHDAEVGAR